MMKVKGKVQKTINFNAGEFHEINKLYNQLVSNDTIRGMTQVAWIAGLGVGPPVAGLAYDLRGSYVIAFAFFGALAVLASLLAVRVRPPVHPEGAQVTAA